MPFPPSTSPLTGEPVPPHYIHASTSQFRDVNGRVLLLRGVNVTSGAKYPTNQPSYKLEGFWEGGDPYVDESKKVKISFVNRVFDLKSPETDKHLKRLREWGFNCVRYIFSWEAIEHEGPGKYDVAYLDYTVRMLRKLKDYGFRVYMDPHQDLFSRFSGGDGAPYWAILACGLNPRNFTVTNAATIECEWPHPNNPRPETYPKMIWASNYDRLAVATLNTLFFAGKDFAPKCVIDGVNIQDYLQKHYLNSVRKLVEKLKDAGDLFDECVFGWDSWNEPNRGFLELQDITAHAPDMHLKVGPTPTAIQGMRLGMGQAVEVEKWKFGSLGPKSDGHILIDPDGKKAWLEPEAEKDGISPMGWKRDPDWKLGQCIWAQHGVWDSNTNEILKPDYFYFSKKNPHQKVNYGQEYWLAHWVEYATLIRGIHKEAIVLFSPPVFQAPPIVGEKTRALLKGRACFSSHFYDGLTLITKHWNWFNVDALGILRGKYPGVVFGLKIGEAAIRKAIRDQLGYLRQDTFDSIGEYPTMIGEIGVPFDLDNKKAYEDGDYSHQTRAWDASLNGCDGENCLNYTIWTYCPENTHKWGDFWNGEDLSIWSRNDAHMIARYKSSGRLATGSRTTLSSSYMGTPDGTPYQSTTQLRNIAPSIMEITRNLLDPEEEEIDPYKLLTLNDGARALSAFCRPYPMATVGTPIFVDFNINSSVFTLTIRVRSDDVNDENLATIIYVPHVHYAAHPKEVALAVLQDPENDDILEPSIERIRSSTCSDGISSRKGSDISQQSNGSRRTRESDASNRGLSISAIADLEYSEDEHRWALDLGVDATGGEWELNGQILRWYYPRPSEGEDAVEYTIKIKRFSGPITTWQRSYGQIYGGLGTPSNAQAAFQVCPSSESCVIS